MAFNPYEIKHLYTIYKADGVLWATYDYHTQLLTNWLKTEPYIRTLYDLGLNNPQALDRLLNAEKWGSWNGYCSLPNKHFNQLLTQ